MDTPELTTATPDAETPQIHTTMNGTRVRFSYVNKFSTFSVTGAIKNPPIPRTYNPDKERTEENPLDPEYLVAVAAADERRKQAAMDVIIATGVHLVDGLPQDDSWIDGLKVQAKLGYIDISRFDLTDKTDLEFLYKRYVALDVLDYPAIEDGCGVGETAIAQAVDRFQRKAKRSADPQPSDQA